jgi:hypothetical protein
MPLQQHEEGVRLLALLKHRSVFRDPPRAGPAQDRIEVRRGKTRKQRQMRHQRTVDLGHPGLLGCGR